MSNSLATVGIESIKRQRLSVQGRNVVRFIHEAGSFTIPINCCTCWRWSLLESDDGVVVGTSMIFKRPWLHKGKMGRWASCFIASSWNNNQSGNERGRANILGRKRDYPGHDFQPATRFSSVGFIDGTHIYVLFVRVNNDQMLQWRVVWCEKPT